MIVRVTLPDGTTEALDLSEAMAASARTAGALADLEERRRAAKATLERRMSETSAARTALASAEAMVREETEKVARLDAAAADAAKTLADMDAAWPGEDAGEDALAAWEKKRYRFAVAVEDRRRERDAQSERARAAGADRSRAADVVVACEGEEMTALKAWHDVLLEPEPNDSSAVPAVGVLVAVHADGSVLCDAGSCSACGERVGAVVLRPRVGAASKVACAHCRRTLIAERGALEARLHGTRAAGFADGLIWEGRAGDLRRVEPAEAGEVRARIDEIDRLLSASYRFEC